MRGLGLSLYDKNHNKFLKVISLFILKIFILYSKHGHNCKIIKIKRNLLHCSFVTELLF